MSNETRKTDPAKALEHLEQAWAYYEPEQVLPATEKEPELFEYANAA